MLDALFAHDVLWFSLPAVFGTGVFLIFIFMMLTGVAVDAHAGGDPGGGFDAVLDDPQGVGIDGDDASGDSFKVLSLQSIAAFMMGFGWGGFAARQTFAHDSYALAIVTGAGIGVAMVYVLGLSLKAVRDLQSSGNISIHEAVGSEGEVYVRVPGDGGGLGRVRVVIHEHQRIYNARTEGEELPRSSRVRVVGVSGSTLVVTRV